MYHFLSGYTARVAGTEKGVTEPKGLQHLFRCAVPAPQSQRLCSHAGREIAKHDSRVWLVNTGWTGGPYGVGAHEDRLHAR